LVTIAATKIMEQIVEQRTAEQLKNTINTAIGGTAQKTFGHKKI
jgi:hypothetical protein